ncbi:MAG: DNA repair protein RecO [Candidatus Lightella neohaematopini]|nr:DNA repair protein RecO [Candidatus Lightella neohaematopini]MCV2529001.1 DNA repair protein RecO [Candidatus Lightella neohaematopini]
MKIKQNAFVLHRYLYKETSLIVICFTEYYGLVKLVANGARASRSNFRGMLQPFMLLTIYYGGKGNIKTLYKAEQISITIPITGRMIYGGLYFNELILKLITYNYDHLIWFHKYLYFLKTLAREKNSLKYIVCCFELSLLKYLGCDINLMFKFNNDLKNKSLYRYQTNNSFVNTNKLDYFSFSYYELFNIANYKFKDDKMLNVARRFTKIILTYYFGLKNINSYIFIS